MRDAGPDTDQEAKARRQAQLEQVGKYCICAIKLKTPNKLCSQSREGTIINKNNLSVACGVTAGWIHSQVLLPLSSSLFTWWLPFTLLILQRHLEAYRNMHRLRDALQRRYATLLKDKVQSQRFQLQQRQETTRAKSDTDSKQVHHRILMFK